MPTIDFAKMREKWPSPVIARTEVSRFTGGLVNPRTLANHDSLGTGPKGRFKFGRKTAYPIEAFLQWLEERSTTPPLSDKVRG